MYPTNNGYMPTPDGQYLDRFPGFIKQMPQSRPNMLPPSYPNIPTVMPNSIYQRPQYPYQPDPNPMRMANTPGRGQTDPYLQSGRAMMGRPPGMVGQPPIRPMVKTPDQYIYYPKQSNFMQRPVQDYYPPRVVKQQQHQEIVIPENQEYNLLGLLKVITNFNEQEKDLKILSLGIDLMELGLNLHANETEMLYQKFSSPFPSPSTKDSSLYPPIYKIPKCYSVSTPLVRNVFESMSEQSLFYVFYTSPGDVAQAHAMDKLYSIGWRYHKIEKKWYMLGQYDGKYFDVDSFEVKPYPDKFPDRTCFVTEQEVKDNLPPL